MCCCAKPNRNGQPGYSWDGKSIGVSRIDPPDPVPNSTILYDEPGRCKPMLNGKPYRIDHHSHHYQVIKDDIGRIHAFVKHGGGMVEFGNTYNMEKLAALMAPMDSDARFIMLMSLESWARHAAEEAERKERGRWQRAAAQKRIKTRKMRDGVKVWIIEEPQLAGSITIKEK